ncbi:MAG: glutamine amidotransferase family protein [Actinobacteria bacterium]|nr:glutamine amidotransferase family protein [Actinomycetota bacterium]
MFCRDDKDFAGCAVTGIMNQKGKRFSGEAIIKSIACMHDRSNGLGGGFAAYGIYPDYKDFFVFHMMYQSTECRYKGEEFLKSNFNVIKAEKIPTRKTPSIKNEPVLWRYFLEVGKYKPEDISEEDYVVDIVMKINSCIEGVFVSSSGKNMGVFKGVGFPEDIGEFFKLEDYKGYTWLAHGRFPTNTQGWWGGAHPFNLLNWSVVHNGELSSYGINKRYLEMYGYICTLMTDTEVVAYTMDLLMRRHKLPLDLVAAVIAAPLWSKIDRMNEEEKELYTRLRQTYSSILLNGPFSFIIANNNEMIGITDRIRLRPLVAATKDEWYYISTEESAVRLISPELDRVWQPCGGEPVAGRLECEA